MKIINEVKIHLFLLVLVSPALVCHSAAAAFTVRYLTDLSRARSKTEVDQLKQDYERLKIVTLACEIQRRERSAPTVCYESLALHNQLGLLTSKETLNREIKKLDSLCMAAIEGRELAGPFVSAVCAKKINERYARQIYRAAETEEMPAHQGGPVFEQ